MSMEPDIIKQEIRTLLERMGLGGDIVEIEMHHGAASRFCVRMISRDGGIGADGGRASLVNMLIGEHGANLSALEHLVKKIIKKRYGDRDDQNEATLSFTLDINDYRIRRLGDLKLDIKDAAKQVRTSGHEVPMRPMSSFERRIVHLLLAEYPDIATESIGREPVRRVVIKPYP